MLKPSWAKSKLFCRRCSHKFMSPGKNLDKKLHTQDALKFFDSTCPVSAYKSSCALNLKLLAVHVETIKNEQEMSFDIYCTFLAAAQESSA